MKWWNQYLGVLQDLGQSCLTEKRKEKLSQYSYFEHSILIERGIWKPPHC